jgi:hypothetical protein
MLFGTREAHVLASLVLPLRHGRRSNLRLDNVVWAGGMRMSLKSSNLKISNLKMNSVRTRLRYGKVNDFKTKLSKQEISGEGAEMS